MVEGLIVQLFKLGSGTLEVSPDTLRGMALKSATPPGANPTIRPGLAAPRPTPAPFPGTDRRGRGPVPWETSYGMAKGKAKGGKPKGLGYGKGFPTDIPRRVWDGSSSSSSRKW